MCSMESHSNVKMTMTRHLCKSSLTLSICVSCFFGQDYRLAFENAQTGKNNKMEKNLHSWRQMVWYCF